MKKWQPISTDISSNRLQMRGMEGFWAAIAPFNFTAISGHLAGAPAFMVRS
jgi:1-pyrroline-5-carboxylate dehydrogenase